MTVRFIPAAEAELEDAITYYEEEFPGLGARFLSEVDTVVNRILELPLARFPYGIIYTHEGANITVLGVFHLHRKPRRWRTRLVE